jgi:hypothetical protein
MSATRVINVKFDSNGKNEIFFVDGSANLLTSLQKEALTAASAHFIESFRLQTEVDVYISKRSVLHIIADQNRTRAWHIAPSFDRDNSIVCVFVDPDSDIETNIVSLAHEFIHAWQVDRGDLIGMTWKGEDLHELPYQLQPWEIEAHGNMASVADYFFRDSIPTTAELHGIQSATEEVFGEIKKSIQTARLRDSFKNTAKVAAGLGLAALVGL